MLIWKDRHFEKNYSHATVPLRSPCRAEAAAQRSSCPCCRRRWLGTCGWASIPAVFPRTARSFFTLLLCTAVPPGTARAAYSPCCCAQLFPQELRAQLFHLAAVHSCSPKNCARSFFTLLLCTRTTFSWKQASMLEIFSARLDNLFNPVLHTESLDNLES